MPGPLFSRRLTLFNIAVLKEGKPQQSRNDLIQPKPGLLMIKSSPDALIWLIWLRANPVAASLTRPQMGQSSIPETWRGFCFTLESCFWRESGWKVAWPLISLHCSFERGAGCSQTDPRPSHCCAVYCICQLTCISVFAFINYTKFWSLQIWNMAFSETMSHLILTD